jgi:hypothetical protein
MVFKEVIFDEVIFDQVIFDKVIIPHCYCVDAASMKLKAKGSYAYFDTEIIFPYLLFPFSPTHKNNYFHID